jgi:hypothetical protein
MLEIGLPINAIEHRSGASQERPKRQRPRSSVTSGRKQFVFGNPNTAWSRRFHDLVMGHVADAGGRDRLSEAEMALIKRAAGLECECEKIEGRMSQDDDVDLDRYGRAASHLRRLLETLGLQRRARDVSPSLAQLLALDRRAAGDPNGQGSAWARFPGHPPSGVGADPETAPAALRAESGARHSAGEGSPPMRSLDPAATGSAAEGQNAPAVALRPLRAIPGGEG